jgi:hypothetical protein
MPPICSADVSDSDLFLHTGASAPSNAVYTMQYSKYTLLNRRKWRVAPQFLPDSRFWEKYPVLG